MTTKEVLNRYLAGDVSYGDAIELLIECGMSVEDATTLIDDIDYECDYD